MLEPLGHDFLTHHLLTQADIAYQLEARYDDALTAQAGPEKDRLAYAHALRRGDDLLATMRTRWRKTQGRQSGGSLPYSSLAEKK